MRFAKPDVNQSLYLLVIIHALIDWWSSLTGSGSSHLVQGSQAGLVWTDALHVHAYVSVVVIMLGALLPSADRRPSFRIAALPRVMIFMAGTLPVVMAFFGESFWADGFHGGWPVHSLFLRFVLSPVLWGAANLLALMPFGMFAVSAERKGPRSDQSAIEP